MTGTSDYARVEQAIRFLLQHQRRQPALAEVARAVGLSAFHFQRLFHRWAGVTPKAFLRFVTLAHAKRLLDEARPLLDSSLAVGLSGPGRLHDLFSSIEGMTPGEYRARAAGLVVRWGMEDTPFGPAIFAGTDRGLCGLAFTGADAAATVDEMRRAWPGATWRRDRAFVRPWAAELRARVRGEAPRPLAVLLKGTTFQIQVWRALLQVPEGAIASYGSLARMVGAPAAARAVGAAVGANPIAWLIPCHRVIRSTGLIGDYHWGADRKATILAVEHARRAPAEGAGGRPTDSA